RQTSLQVGQSVASVLASRGIFDPVIDFQKDAKRLSGDRYYDHNNPEIKLFTPLGITLKAGVENNIGKYLNPELTNGVLSYAGVEIPVLQGLLIDKKRAALRQAEIIVNQTEEERRAILNDLYLNAITDYWYWTAAYRELQIIDQNLEIALQRLELTRVLFTNGEKAAADTTEAAGQVLALQLQQSAAVQEFQKAGVNL